MNVLIFLSIYYAVTAQANNGKISGTITDANNKPIAAVTVALTMNGDTTIIKAMAANVDGKFAFRNLQPGKYVIVINGLGYKNYNSAAITIDDKHTAILLPDIALELLNPQALKDVIVNSKKPLVEHKIDRDIVNTDAMISAAGSNALEVLGRSPGVMVDMNGNISLYGTGGVLVSIDDKQTYMAAQDLAAYLRSLPGSLIDRIELMSNPPSKYDASGNAVINIILKKNKTAGFNGNVNMAYNQGVYGRTNDALNLNYRTKKMNLFGNTSYSHDANFGDGNYSRYFYGPGGATASTLLTNNLYNYTSNSGFIRTGLDYFATANTTFGILLTGGTRPKNDANNYTSNQYNSSMKLDSVATGFIDGKYTWQNAVVNLNFQHKFNTTGKVLTADLDYINYHSSGNQYSSNNTYEPDSNLNNVTNTKYALPSNINIWSAKTDYMQPFAGHITFDAGVKSSYVTTDNNNEWFNDSNNIITPDYVNTNHFIYKENINAAYIDASKEWNRLSVKGGLRAENTIANGHQVGNIAVPDSSFTKNYTILFPTFYVLYKLDTSGNSILKFSYGLRVRRPNYQQLDPFLLYHDAYTYSAGNTGLKPALNHVFELVYAYKNFFGVSLAYLHIKDDVYSLAQDIGQVFITRPENFGTDNSFNIRPYISISPVAGWHVDADVLLFHLVNRGFAYGQAVDNSITTGEVEVDNQFSFGHGWSGELYGFFAGKMDGGQSNNDPVWRIDAGLQKQLFNKKGTLRLNVNDIFRTMVMRSKTIIAGEATAYQTNMSDTRRGGVSFSYRFGKDANARKRNHNSGGAGDEQGRVD